MQRQHKMKYNPIIKNILYCVQGAIVGIGAILPGVSGGVLCVSFGIYEPMMEFLTHPLTAWKKHSKIFLPFALGWVLGFLLLAKLLEIFFSAAASIALMLFLGLICGTLPDLFKSSEKSDSKKSWTPFILSLVLAYLFFHLLEHAGSITLSPSFGSFLFCGFLWGLSMIIPGFSSSSVLICLGLYEPMTAGIAALDLSVLLPMFLGIGVTALAFARLIHILFQKHYTVTLRVVLGFVTASSLKIIPSSFSDPLTFAIALLCFAIGFASARGMDLAKEKQESHNQQERKLT
jgi:putative membrane protein